MNTGRVVITIKTNKRNSNEPAQDNAMPVFFAGAHVQTPNPYETSVPPCLTRSTFASTMYRSEVSHIIGSANHEANQGQAHQAHHGHKRQLRFLNVVIAFALNCSMASIDPFANACWNVSSATSTAEYHSLTQLPFEVLTDKHFCKGLRRSATLHAPPHRKRSAAYNIRSATHHM